MAYKYVIDLLQIYTPARTLRSSSSVFLIQPHINLNSMGSRAFSYAAPYLWNALPQDIRNSDSFHTFKSRLIYLKVPYCTPFWSFILGFDVLKNIYCVYIYIYIYIYMYIYRICISTKNHLNILLQLFSQELC